MATRRYPLSFMTILMAILLAFVPGILATPAAQARDISGNTYTSPTFGYSMTWDNTWLVMKETSESYDLLQITNGIGYVNLFGFEAYGGSGQLAAVIFAAGVQNQDGISDYTLVSQEGDASRYSVTITFTITFDDGGSAQLTEYIEARTVEPGVSVVIFDGYSQTDLYSVTKPAFDTLLGTLTVGSGPPNGGAVDEPEIELVKGEEGPVYMAGPWRIAVVAAAQGPDLPGVGLDEKEGKEWVVVVADVTNWGSSDPAFPAEDFFVQMVEADTQHKVASGSTAAVARELDLPEDAGAVEIEYGNTGRLVMAFSVNAGRTEPSLVYRNQLFPLDEILIGDFEAGDLSEPAGPPELQEATLVSISTDGETLRVQYEGESKSHRISLLGIDPSATVEQAVELLAAYEGETVFIETDPAIDEASTPAVYLWIDNERGDRAMLNQMLLEEGAAVYDPLPQDSRFGLWLQVTADSAQAN